MAKEFDYLALRNGRGLKVALQPPGAPLLEEERHAGFLALREQVLCPFRVHGAGTVFGLPAADDPVDAHAVASGLQVPANVDGPEKRLT
ncbi:hypothetical protein D3C85_1670780 [compost metagenome]